MWYNDSAWSDCSRGKVSSQKGDMEKVVGTETETMLDKGVDCSQSQHVKLIHSRFSHIHLVDKSENDQL